MAGAGFAYAKIGDTVGVLFFVAKQGDREEVRLQLKTELQAEAVWFGDEAGDPQFDPTAKQYGPPVFPN